MKIQTPRLELQPFSAQDAAECYACITPTLTRYMTWEPAASRAEFDQIWSNWLVSMTEQRELVCVIRSNTTQQFLGLVALHQMHTATPELGIWIREDAHGHGHGREAVTALWDWAKSLGNIDYFIYPVAQQNQASRRIAESLNGVIQAKELKPKYTALIYHIPTWG
ncbi:RimJ/RimL family protein N-acetyltransferase [Acinetobacter calcoaceticus]|uniref:RimJ/RimL family protein N-acetyltransferase n=1 Tax=Acinetobacter calcoaceticus TaxID=471 RepID=A0A4R1XGB6_ACICA|nr:RimJ/RimL family protein N-acetyltransferase [Acinetobacter calcoaceticus]